MSTYPCPSVGRAVLCAVDPRGALMKCGLERGHRGPHQTTLTWWNGTAYDHTADDGDTIVRGSE